jgi:hypothetical protein
MTSDESSAVRKDSRERLNAPPPGMTNYAAGGIVSSTFHNDRPGKIERVHIVVNRILTTVALLLTIVVLAISLFVAHKIETFGDWLGEKSDELIQEFTPPDDFSTPPTYEDPTGSVPDDYYVGETYPDGTPCEGYGCTPEQDAELDQAEREANG